jgi:hypothetical protein
MKPWLFVVVGLSFLATLGCRTDPAIPLLERELRLKDDEIYRLRRTVDEMQDCSGGRCTDRVVDGGRSKSESREEPPRRRDAPDVSGGGFGGVSVELPGQPSNSVPDSLKGGDTKLPAIGGDDAKKPAPDKRSPKDPPRDRASRRLDRPRPLNPDDEGPSLEGPPTPARTTTTGMPSKGVPFLPSGSSRRTASIVLNRGMTGGVSNAPGIGDQGILVVVEPRDRDGRNIDAPGEMSVVVVDPTLQGNAARVARWDFTPEETAAAFRRTGETQAIHLVGTWPNDPPVHNRLHLFVRYTTADGRKLQADQAIEVALAGDRRMVQEPPRPARPANADSPEDAPRRAAERQPRRQPRPDDTASRPVWSPERR